MADVTTENTNNVGQPAPVVNSESKAPGSSDSLPPITKEPLKTAEAPLVPNSIIQTKPADVPAAPASDSSTNDKAPPALGKEELAKKIEAADALGAQPEKPDDPVPSSSAQPVTTEVTPAAAPSLPNGDKTSPQPVSVEEVRDEELPDVKPQGATGTVPSDKPTPEPAKTPNDPVAAEIEKASPDVGDKRKAEEVSTSNGASSPSIVPVEPTLKKQKTGDSASTNGAAAKKPGRPKKEKKTVAPVGRTARKTRSQGAAD